MKRIHWLAMLMASAPSFAADEMVMYGRVLGGMQNLNAAARVERGDAGAVGRSTEINDLYSRWGVKGEERLPNDLRAFFQIESSLAIDTGGGGFATREGWVGLKGDFGLVKLGRGKTPYTHAAEYYDNFIASHTFASAHFGTGYYGISDNYRSNNTLWYSTPKFANLQGDFAYFTGENKSANGLNSRGISLGLSGTWEKFDTYVAYQKVRDYEAVKGNDLDQFVAGASYFMGGLTVGAQHGQSRLRPGAGQQKVKATTLFGSYAFDDIGPALRAGYASQTAGASKADTFNLGGHYGLSKRTYALAEYYTKRVKNGPDPTVLTIGLGHNF